MAEKSWAERVTNSAIESHVYAWDADATMQASQGVERLTVTVAQAAVMLGISRTSAYERVRRGEIPSVRLGRRLLVPKVRLLAMLGDEPPANAPAADEAA